MRQSSLTDFQKKKWKGTLINGKLFKKKLWEPFPNCEFFFTRFSNARIFDFEHKIAGESK